ncbi:MAG: hypothetical protein HGA19_14505 [Oscillochloris sp.]|nr:hypothetical protein [Oscillochloris sp.]
MNQLALISSQLQQILPIELQHEAPIVARVIDDLLAGTTDQATAQRTLNSLPNIKQITKSLYGRRIDYQGSQLSFGANNQFGDVSIGDIAGGDIYKFNITIVSPEKEMSRFSILLTKASDVLAQDIADKQRVFWPVIVLGGLSVLLACSPFVPHWIPAAGIIAAFISQWLLIEGQKQIAWVIWWISIGVIILLMLLQFSLVMRLR